MKIFLGSSRESIDVLKEVAVWIEEQGFEPIPWDKPGLFIPGSNTLHRLIEISRQVDGAIFLFSEDDKVWYRADTTSQPRDNVLIEYGLFVGALGAHKAIIFKNGKPRPASDILGISFIDVSENRRHRAKLETNIWCRNLTKDKADPALLQLQAKIYQLERDKTEISDRLNFESEKSKELSKILTSKGIIDFEDYDLSLDGHWKLLFNFDYVFQVSRALIITFQQPKNLLEHLKKVDSEDIKKAIVYVPEDTDRLAFYIRKVLRLYRMQNVPEKYMKFIESLKLERPRIDDIAREVISNERI